MSDQIANDTDDQLVERIQAHPHAAAPTFEVLVARHQRFVVANCRLITRAPNDAEDLAQDGAALGVLKCCDEHADLYKKQTMDRLLVDDSESKSAAPALIAAAKRIRSGEGSKSISGKWKKPA